MNDEQKLEPRGPWEVVRRFRLPSLTTAADAQAIREVLEDKAGIEGYVLELPNRRLRVRYDVNRIDYKTLLRLLEQAGHPLPPTWRNRLRASLYQYADDNARDNAKAPPPPCCNKPPR
jgi:hypothetical protein